MSHSTLGREELLHRPVESAARRPKVPARCKPRPPSDNSPVVYSPEWKQKPKNPEVVDSVGSGSLLNKGTEIRFLCEPIDAKDGLTSQSLYAIRQACFKYKKILCSLKEIVKSSKE